jgi:NADH:ubiquinone oxidoreductase subunit 5 (subunit L)/multisubunit Na+/H+ antiporter MnhA subunit
VEEEFLVRLAADPIKDKPIENIFRITDEIVHQLNKTKKMIILMIVSIVVVLPATHIISFALIGDTIFDDDNERPPFDRSSGPPDSPGFRIVQAVVIGTVLFWLGIGIRQWFVFSKWTKKYKQYKELQKNIDEKLMDDDNSNNDKGKGGQSQ